MSKQYLSVGAVCAVCLVVLASPALSDVMVFQAGVAPDAGYDHLGQTMFEGTYTSHNNMLVGRHTAASLLKMRGVLAFDLSDLPAGAVVQAVELVLTAPSGSAGSGSAAGIGDVHLYELQPGGSLANEVNADVDWTNYRTGTAWNTPGGDFGTKLQTVPSGDLGFNKDETTTFDTSAAFVTAAQGAFDADRPLQMIVQAPTAEGNASASNYMRWTRPNDGTDPASYRPKLTVTYVPEPVTAVLLAVGAVVLSRRRRSF